MRRNDEGGVVLTDTEREALALFLVARLARPGALHEIEWDDVPELAEGAWVNLQAEIDRVCDDLMSRADMAGEDSRYIWGEVS